MRLRFATMHSIFHHPSIHSSIQMTTKITFKTWITLASIQFNSNVVCRRIINFLLCNSFILLPPLLFTIKFVSSRASSRESLGLVLNISRLCSCSCNDFEKCNHSILIVIFVQQHRTSMVWVLTFGIYTVTPNSIH